MPFSISRLSRRAGGGHARKADRQDRQHSQSIYTDKERGCVLYYTFNASANKIYTFTQLPGCMHYNIA